MSTWEGALAGASGRVTLNRKNVPTSRRAPSGPVLQAGRSPRSFNVTKIAADEREPGRLPMGTAAPLILFLSLAGWAIVMTAALWLDRFVA